MGSRPNSFPVMSSYSLNPLFGRPSSYPKNWVRHIQSTRNWLECVSGRSRSTRGPRGSDFRIPNPSSRSAFFENCCDIFVFSLDFLLQGFDQWTLTWPEKCDGHCGARIFFLTRVSSRPPQMQPTRSLTQLCTRAHGSGSLWSKQQHYLMPPWLWGDLWKLIIYWYSFSIFLLGCYPFFTFYTSTVVLCNSTTSYIVFFQFLRLFYYLFNP